DRGNTCAWDHRPLPRANHSVGGLGADGGLDPHRSCRARHSPGKADRRIACPNDGPTARTYYRGFRCRETNLILRFVFSFAWGLPEGRGQVLGKFPTCRRSLFLLALEQLSGAFGRYIGSALGVIARFVSLTPGF